MTHLKNSFPTEPVQAQFPPALIFGTGKRATLPETLKNWGSANVAVVAADVLKESVGEMTRAIRSAGIEVRIVYCQPAEPRMKDFVHVCEELGEPFPDTVIGIGGGSVLDVAKLVAALGDRPGQLRAYVGKGLLESRKARLVCIPTTSGAGSEGSPNAIMVDEEDHAKKAVISPHLIPDMVLIDPELTVSVPPHVTAATGFDALCHCIEAYANKYAHALVDGFALQGISLIAGNIAKATNEGTDIGARRAMALGSYLGGLCLGPVNTAAVHALSYPLGSAFGLPHGLANAILMPAVFRYNLPAMPERYARIALAMGVGEAESPEATAEAGIRLLEDLIDQCSLREGLKRFTIDSSQFPELARQALQITRLLNNNPREVDLAAAQSIYRQSFPDS